MTPSKLLMALTNKLFEKLQETLYKRVTACLQEGGDIFSICYNYIFNLVCFLLGNSPASEFYTPMFWNTLSVPSL